MCKYWGHIYWHLKKIISSMYLILWLTRCHHFFFVLHEFQFFFCSSHCIRTLKNNGNFIKNIWNFQANKALRAPLVQSCVKNNSTTDKARGGVNDLQNRAIAAPTCTGDALLLGRPLALPGGLKSKTGASSGKKWEKLCSDSLYVAMVDGYNKKRNTI